MNSGTSIGPTVSVLMTAYNREKYIAHAIESVLSQTYEDFELLVVDDCSTDSTVAIARRYCESDARVKLIVNAENLGQFKNRNHAAQLANGRYFKFHDSDDVMYRHCLAVMVEALDDEPQAGFALSAARYWPGGPCPMLLTPRMCYQREFLGSGMFSGGPANALFRTRAFWDLGGFEDRGVPSDDLFWVRACRELNVLLIPADLYWYRIHPEQELHSQVAPREYAQAFGERWNALLRDDCPLNVDEVEQGKRNLVWNLARATWRDIRAGRWSLATFRLRHSNVSVLDWIKYLRGQHRDLAAGSPPSERDDCNLARSGQLLHAIRKTA